MSASWEIREGDALERLAEMPDGSVQCCVTSPPYFGLRDYGVDGQIGLEATPIAFVARLVEAFREVRRVLRSDGTLWLNIGDSYAAGIGGLGNNPSASSTLTTNNGRGPQPGDKYAPGNEGKRVRLRHGVKPKDLLGIPWLLAFALRADGWYLRSDIIWAKPNPMPESVTDRPTSAHEHVFLLAKSRTYYYDADAIREPHTDSNGSRNAAQRRHGTTASGERVTGASLPESPYVRQGKDRGLPGVGTTFAGWNPEGRNKRNVWEIATQPYSEAHFATFPPKLVEPCILAGSSPKACGVCGAPRERMVEREVPIDPGKSEASKVQAHDPALVDASSLAARTATRRLGQAYQDQLDANPRRTIGWQPSCDHDDDTGRSVILDPFAGAGTTGLVALRHDRSFIGIELNPAYAEMARERIRHDAPLLNCPAEVAA